MSYSLNKETMNYYIENNKLGSTVTYEYKDGNVVKSTHEYFGDYPAVIVISYEYADMDNLLVTLDKLLDYQFNGSNRANIYSTPHTQSKKLLTKITYIHSRPEYSSSAEYSYDFNSNGLPTKVYKATFEYPSNSNLGTSNEAYEYIMR
jgi:aromatic ring-opening dioxygenase catalytic subunit (LigB family)